MIFSSHVLANAPLTQFKLMHLSRTPCARDPVPSAGLTLESSRTLPVTERWRHRFLSACLNLSWAPLLSFGSYFLTSWCLLLAAPSLWQHLLSVSWVEYLNERLLSPVLCTWRGTSSLSDFCHLSMPFTSRPLIAGATSHSGTWCLSLETKFH